MRTYEEFLRSKMELAPKSGFEIDLSEINPVLKPHQRDAVQWAVRGGRRALFERFGLGKTIQELEWCRIITEHQGGKALLVLPLGVRQEFTHDAQELLHIAPPQYVRTMAEDGNAESKRAGAVEYALRRSECIVISHSNQQMRNRPKQYKDTAGREGLANGSWWPAEPRVGRVAHGVPHRVDRLKGLGNAVVPAQFYPFFVTIAEIERGE